MQSLFARASSAAVAVLPLLACPAAAEAAAQNDADIEEVVVTAHPLSGGGLSEAVIVLDGEELERELADNIGATVARQPGVHVASFGEAVGRPVVHGLSGPRVRIMEDRIDAMDASTTSGDHAVTVEPFIANQVELLKGPSTLLYGSSAIGGVVGVNTGRIPRDIPERLSGRATVRAADNGNRTNAAVRLDGHNGGQLAWHLDGFKRSADEYDIPGFAESARFRAAEEAEEHAADHDDEEEADHEEEEVFGRLPGSQSAGHGGTFGAAWVGERGFGGVAASRLNYNYGLPGGSHAAHHDEHEDEEHGADEGDEGDEGGVTLDLQQTRFDFEAGVEIPFLSGARPSVLNFRFASNDYAHTEVEPNGDIGTRFAVDSYEGRVELAQQDGDGLDGVGGLQFGKRRFSALGEEAFVPPVDTTSVGVFFVSEADLGSFDLEGGARFERVRHEPLTAENTSFSVMSASIGVVRPGSAVLGIHGGYSARAPAAEELYSNGPHLATGSFEVGDSNLDVESAWHGSATLSWSGTRATLTGTAYVTAFRDHIYASADGTIEDDLPVMRYSQADVLLRGIDLAASVAVAELDGGSVALTFLADAVAARVDGQGNDRLPRLPPSRLGIGLTIERGRYDAELDYLHTFEQDQPTDFELPTDAYGDLRLHVGADYVVGNARVRLFLQGRNLTDEEQRHHASFIKDLAPAPGRTWVVGTEVAF